IGLLLCFVVVGVFFLLFFFGSKRTTSNGSRLASIVVWLIMQRGHAFFHFVQPFLSDWDNSKAKKKASPKVEEKRNQITPIFFFFFFFFVNATLFSCSAKTDKNVAKNTPTTYLQKSS